jgi:GrpB-like predicted nucleotidyltransferase (UPF0157 family)
LSAARAVRGDDTAVEPVDAKERTVPSTEPATDTAELSRPARRAAPALPPTPATGRAAEDTELAPYHPSWPARFRVEAEVLRVALASLAPVIEHVGSTAVPGLSALPVIDIAVGVAAPMAVDAQADRLANFGYRLLTAPETMAPGRRTLLRTVRGVRTHQVHVMTAFGDAWQRLLMFRDMLRLDHDLAKSYESLKHELARQTQGRPLLYAAGKADFIRSVLGRPAFDAGDGY